MTGMAVRDDLLDSFTQILATDGERAATLDAVAAAAKVSKGGLLYHFGSKKALVDGLLDRLRLLARDDIAQMRADPRGAAHYYVSTSVLENSPLDRALIACAILSQGADDRARAAIAEIRGQWLEVLTEQVGDQQVAWAILLVGDGLYYNEMLTGSGASEVPAVEGLLEVVERLIQSASGKSASGKARDQI